MICSVLTGKVLLKPRVMSLVVFTAVTGLLLAPSPPGSLSPLTGFFAVLCIALGAGASGTINMWYDRDIDLHMLRTMNRPLPAGRLEPKEALIFGIALAAGSVTAMAVLVNTIAALLLALTILYYVFIYTVWLKRRTPQNIVIGGAAGAFPPVIGWAAVTGEVSLASIALFMIIFVWTPPHFWALALYRAGDYAKAGVPMLPVVAGQRETKKQILLYVALLVPITLAPYAIGLAGALYGAGAAGLGLIFLLSAARVWFDQTDRSARRMFGFSILYLFLLFALMVVDRVPNFSG